MARLHGFYIGQQSCANIRPLRPYTDPLEGIRKIAGELGIGVGGSSARWKWLLSKPLSPVPRRSHRGRHSRTCWARHDGAGGHTLADRAALALPSGQGQGHLRVRVRTHWFRRSRLRTWSDRFAHPRLPEGQESEARPCGELKSNHLRSRLPGARKGWLGGEQGGGRFGAGRPKFRDGIFRIWRCLKQNRVIGIGQHHVTSITRPQAHPGAN